MCNSFDDGTPAPRRLAFGILEADALHQGRSRLPLAVATQVSLAVDDALNFTLRSMPRGPARIEEGFLLIVDSHSRNLHVMRGRMKDRISESAHSGFHRGVRTGRAGGFGWANSCTPPTPRMFDDENAWLHSIDTWRAVCVDQRVRRFETAIAGST